MSALVTYKLRYAYEKGRQMSCLPFMDDVIDTSVGQWRQLIVDTNPSHIYSFNLISLAHGTHATESQIYELTAYAA